MEYSMKHFSMTVISSCNWLIKRNFCSKTLMSVSWCLCHFWWGKSILQISNNHHSIQHLQPFESCGPSNQRSQNWFIGPFVIGSKGSGLVSTLLSISLHADEAFSIFSSFSSSSSKNLTSCSSRFSSACIRCFPLVSAAGKDWTRWVIGLADSDLSDCIAAYKNQ